MNKSCRGTLWAAGICGASLLISPVAFAVEGTGARGGTVGVGQQTKQHTGMQYQATGRRTETTSVKPEETRAQ
jgi:hypothetical protein